jgi:hypothetical protein
VTTTISGHCPRGGERGISVRRFQPPLHQTAVHEPNVSVVILSGLLCLSHENEAPDMEMKYGLSVLTMPDLGILAALICLCCMSRGPE